FTHPRRSSMGPALVPSPLLDADLPPWMRLHFQADADGWESPQVLSPALQKHLRCKGSEVALVNVTEARRRLLEQLAHDLPGSSVLASARKHAGATSLRDRTLLLAQRQLELSNWNNNDRNQAQEVQNTLEYMNRYGQ